MFVIPQAGYRIRDPVKRDVVPAYGREVDDRDPYWQRRVRVGDVTVRAAAIEEDSTASASAPVTAVPPSTRSPTKGEPRS